LGQYTRIPRDKPQDYLIIYDVASVIDSEHDEIFKHMVYREA
jgi:hypothetical protein